MEAITCTRRARTREVWQRGIDARDPGPCVLDAGGTAAPTMLPLSASGGADLMDGIWPQPSSSHHGRSRRESGLFGLPRVCDCDQIRQADSSFMDGRAHPRGEDAAPLGEASRLVQPLREDAMLHEERLRRPPVTGQSWASNIHKHSARAHLDDLVAVDIIAADARLRRAAVCVGLSV